MSLYIIINMNTMDTIIEVIAVLGHYFKLGLKTATTSCRIQKIEENETIADDTGSKTIRGILRGVYT